jgi:hypothetical protein
MLFSIFAENKSITASGSNQYGAITIDSLESTGLIKLNGTSITHHINLTGSLISQNAEIGSLEVMGEANLTGTTVQEASSIIGSLQATRSNFKKALTILTQKALFTASKLEGVTVQKDGACKGKQIIELRQGTIVNGPIHFESGKGEVIVSSGSQILGEVVGGKVIKKS